MYLSFRCNRQGIANPVDISILHGASSESCPAITNYAGLQGNTLNCIWESVLELTQDEIMYLMSSTQWVVTYSPELEAHDKFVWQDKNLHEGMPKLVKLMMYHTNCNNLNKNN